MTERFAVKHIMFDGWCIYDAVNDKYYVYNKNDLELLSNVLNELDENWIKELNLRETFQLELQRVEEENKQLKQDIRELQNDNLLTELQMKCDKKQEHIVVLENKIHRMREAIHKLEWLASHRNADLQRENWQLKQQFNYIQNSISEHIKHQKTELGQKALQEIIEDYNEWLLGHKRL